MADTVLPVRPPGPHPTPEQLYRACHGPRTSEVERWLAHAAACASCTEELLHQEAFDAPQPLGSGDLAAAWKRFGKPPSPSRRPSGGKLRPGVASSWTVIGEKNASPRSFSLR